MLADCDPSSRNREHKMTRSQHKLKKHTGYFIMLAVAMAALATPCRGQQSSTSAAVTPSATSSVAGWTTTSDLNIARSGHSATLLQSGKVLVFGGDNNGRLLDSAELFDPATSKWTITGRMKWPREYGNSATLLRDGRVLAAGYGTSEVYDPQTGRWAETGRMVTERAYHAAKLLADGRVLVAGGDMEYGFISAESFDPSTGTWTPAGRFFVDKRYGYATTILEDGRVLVVGEGGQDPISTARIPLHSRPTSMIRSQERGMLRVR